MDDDDTDLIKTLLSPEKKSIIYVVTISIGRISFFIDKLFIGNSSLLDDKSAIWTG